MEKKFLSGLLLSAVLLFSACSKKNGTNDNTNDESLDDFVAIPEAQYNNSNYGVYKGVFIGSKGIVYIMVNNDNTLGAVLKVDGTNYTFKTTQTIPQNQPTSINLVSGSNSFTFTSDANGGNPTISNLVFSGHPGAQIDLLKSYSYFWGDSFECTYKENRTGGETGVFMLLMVAGKVKGLGAADNVLSPYHITGTHVGGHAIFTAPISGISTSISGDVSSDINNISGTFSNVNGSGTWTGKRII